MDKKIGHSHQEEGFTQAPFAAMLAGSSRKATRTHEVGSPVKEVAGRGFIMVDWAFGIENELRGFV